ncbi:MAG: carbohydrate ABC transporter permease [Thermoleophilia bacterium]
MTDGAAAARPSQGARPRTALLVARLRRPAGRRGSVPLWLALPSIGAMAVVLIYPTIYLLGLAFTRSSLGRPLQEWSGWDNFIRANESLAFNGSLWRSAVFAIAGAALQIVLGTALALLLRVRGPRFGLAGTLLLLPLVTPPVMVGVGWKLMLAPVGGPLASTWENLGGSGFDPLASGTGAFITLLLINTWQWMPFVTLLVFAALLSVPQELIEAAEIDGAGAWHRFRAVVWPSILPTVLAASVLTLVIAFKAFDIVAVITRGAPGVSTILAPFEIYRTGLLGDYDMGTAAAETLMFALLVGVVTTALTFVRARVTRAEG